MDEKDHSVRPLGRARDGGPDLALSFRNAIFPFWWRLSPLFYQGGRGSTQWSARVRALANDGVSPYSLERKSQKATHRDR
jgi:hypothetical protein